MKVQVVSFHCVLKNKLGKVISSTFNHDVITHGPQGETVLSGLAEGLQNLKKGEKRRICLSAQQAYGFYDPDKVVVCNKEELPQSGAKLRLGDHVAVQSANNQRQLLRVVEISAGSVTLDGNHPLAGQDLVFEIEATDARDATPEEIADAVQPAETQTFH